MEDNFFNHAFFSGVDEGHIIKSLPKKKKRRGSGYRTGDLVLTSRIFLNVCSS